MSKILFGNNTVAPVKIPGQEVSAGRGIDADLLRGGTIQVDDTVLRSSCTNASGSVIIDDKNASTDGAPVQTAYGRYTVTNGNFRLEIPLLFTFATLDQRIFLKKNRSKINIFRSTCWRRSRYYSSRIHT